MELLVRNNGRIVDAPGRAIKKVAVGLSRVDKAKITRAAALEMRAYLGRVTDAVAQKHTGKFAPGAKRSTLMQRTGKGMQRLKDVDVDNDGKTVTGTIHLNRYMAQHEFGGTIRANGKGYLTIPLPDALKADGTPKKLSARQWGMTQLIKSKFGNLVIVQKRGRRFVPLYALKEEVRIPRRLGLRKALRDERPGLRKGFAQRIRDLVELNDTAPLPTSAARRSRTMNRP